MQNISLTYIFALAGEMSDEEALPEEVLQISPKHTRR